MSNQSEKSEEEKVARSELKKRKAFQAMVETEGGQKFQKSLQGDVLSAIKKLCKYDAPDFCPIPLCAQLAERLAILKEFMNAKSEKEAALEVLNELLDDK